MSAARDEDDLVTMLKEEASDRPANGACSEDHVPHRPSVSLQTVAWLTLHVLGGHEALRGSARGTGGEAGAPFGSPDPSREGRQNGSGLDDRRC
jgi:hypothetical protein